MTCKSHKVYENGESHVEAPRAQPTPQWLKREGQMLSAAAKETSFSFLQQDAPQPAELGEDSAQEATPPELDLVARQPRSRPQREVDRPQRWGSAVRTSDSQASSAKEALRNMLKLIGS